MPLTSCENDIELARWQASEVRSKAEGHALAVGADCLSCLAEYLLQTLSDSVRTCPRFPCRFIGLQDSIHSVEANVWPRHAENFAQLLWSASSLHEMTPRILQIE